MYGRVMLGHCAGSNLRRSTETLPARESSSAQWSQTSSLFAWKRVVSGEAENNFEAIPGLRMEAAGSRRTRPPAGGNRTNR